MTGGSDGDCPDQLKTTMKSHQIEKLADYLLATAIALALAWGAVEYFTM